MKPLAPVTMTRWPGLTSRPNRSHGGVGRDEDLSFCEVGVPLTGLPPKGLCPRAHSTTTMPGAKSGDRASPGLPVLALGVAFHDVVGDDALSAGHRDTDSLPAQNQG